MRKTGFTLIEMLVALSVFALAALALLRLDSLSVRTTADLRDRSMTRLVAMNAVAEVASAPRAPEIGSETFTVTNHGQAFALVRDTRRLPDERVVAVTILARPLEGGAAQRLTLVRPVS
ncbi:type II secretion system minor pseudopilin GspI [Sphingomicrobium nitratireducens]|uniref:type II secretion system minor pseudopilin GspI n=1 Tax=Sphingomicrobium nitratireducens TaxID=2964666 RepID=UPI00223F2510